MTVMISFNSHHLCEVVTPSYAPRFDSHVDFTFRSSLRLVLHLSQGGHDIDRAGLSSSLLNSGVLRVVSISFLVRG
jgi:hypothetical protein